MPMVATGVPTFMSPVLATWPATKLAAPCTRVNSDEFDVLAGVVGQVVQHQARAGVEVEGGAVDHDQTEAGAAAGLDDIVLQTVSPLLRATVTPLRTTLALPVILTTWPTTLAAAAPPCLLPGRIERARSWLR